MATKIIKAWIDGAIQNIEVEDIEVPEMESSVEERLDALEDKPIITEGNFLVGNGTEDMEEITPEEVLSHINGASVMTMTTDEYEALEESNANTLYVLTDSEENQGYYTPSVSQIDENTITVSFTPSNENMEAVEDTNITLPAGATGATPNLTIGTVNTALDGQADAQITGTAENPVLNLWIPKGANGTNGKGIQNMTVVENADSTTVGFDYTDGTSTSFDIPHGTDANVTAENIKAALGYTPVNTTEIPTKVSELTNDSGYITDYTETDPTVPSWAKASTKPSYTKSEVGLGNVDNVKQYSASNPPPYPVTKVNNKTGEVTLSASDVGADASGAANSAVSAHNTNTSAHSDIREQISQLSSEKVVLYSAQTLTEAQKAQVRANIGVDSTNTTISTSSNSWSGKKLLFMGDSITASSSGWVTQIGKILNPALSVNLAVNGAWWNDKEGTVYDGDPVFEGKDNNVNNVIGNQVEKILRGKDTANANYSEVADYAEFDMIFIAAGTNGSTPSEDIETAFYADGSIVPVSSVDRTTWAGAFRYCVEELQRVYPNAKIFICTPIQGVEQSRAYATIKARGDYLKQLCARMSVTCIDTMQCGICGLFEVANANGRDLRDGLHTNASGALKMAKYNAAAVIAHYASEGYMADDTEEEEDLNLVPLSVDTDGNIYNGVGYRNDTYISSSSPLGYSTKSGYVSTGFISAENGDVLYASGTAEWDASDSSCRAFVYDADKNFLGYKQGSSTNSEMNATYGMEVTSTWFDNSTGQNVSPTNIKFIRFALKGTGDGLIISKSPIV